MAITKAKRSWKNKQLAISNWHLAKAKPGNKKQSAVSIQQSVKPKKKSKQPTHNLSAFALPKTLLTHFRELKGKTIEDVVFSTASDHQDITIKLQDKTGLNFSIATGLILKTEYSDWIAGEQRILRRWPLKSAS